MYRQGKNPYEKKEFECLDKQMKTTGLGVATNVSYGSHLCHLLAYPESWIILMQFIKETLSTVSGFAQKIAS